MLPAPAGMSPGRRPRSGGGAGAPRASGDEPLRGDVFKAAEVSAPRASGDEPTVLNRIRKFEVLLPAPAGMNPSTNSII
ncbi:MAG: hypothetical protein ACI38U_08445 [Corynebacterium sp.]